MWSQLEKIVSLLSTQATKDRARIKTLEGELMQAKLNSPSPDKLDVKKKKSIENLSVRNLRETVDTCGIVLEVYYGVLGAILVKETAKSDHLRNIEIVSEYLSTHRTEINEFIKEL